MEYAQSRQDNNFNPDFQGYLIPTAMDKPEIETIIVEDSEPSDPYGAKGVREPALIPTDPAICNARAKGLRKNNFTFSHLIFSSSLSEPQSQNPRNPDWIGVPVDLLNRHSQI
jgi:hypothetical protein